MLIFISRADVSQSFVCFLPSDGETFPLSTSSNHLLSDVQKQRPRLVSDGGSKEKEGLVPHFRDPFMIICD